jgi:hypothetical protein
VTSIRCEVHLIVSMTLINGILTRTSETHTVTYELLCGEGGSILPGYILRASVKSSNRGWATNHGSVARRSSMYSECSMSFRSRSVGTATLPDFAKARKAGHRISTAHVESVMNHLVNHRMGKKRQLRWSPGGAHLLLRDGAERLNGTLTDGYRVLYPGFRGAPEYVHRLARRAPPTCLSLP